MRVLLDTNALIRILRNGDLPRAAQRLLSRPDTETVVSFFTAWEIVMKADLNLSASNVEAGVNRMGAAMLPVQFRHLDEYARLPVVENHRDPFDRMLIAQALSENLAVMTSDSRFENYMRLRVIWD